MPIATPEVYAQMLDKAKQNRFAYQAINVSSSQTLNAAIRGFAEAGSDGIVQVSTGGAEYLSGPTVKNMVSGAVALAAYAHEVAKNCVRPYSTQPTIEHFSRDIQRAIASDEDAALHKFVDGLMRIEGDEGRAV